MKTLVTYFSAEFGVTAKVAKEFAASKGYDLVEIVPEAPYTKADLKYMNPLARCNKEFFSKKDVPVSTKIDNFSDYDTIYIGFPIWYGCAPLVINTFCKGYDWTGKKIVAFATSGGSGIGKTAAKLEPFVKGVASLEATLVHSASDIH